MPTFLRRDECQGKLERRLMTSTKAVVACIRDLQALSVPSATYMIC